MSEEVENEVTDEEGPDLLKRAFSFLQELSRFGEVQDNAQIPLGGERLPIDDVFRFHIFPYLSLGLFFLCFAFSVVSHFCSTELFRMRAVSKQWNIRIPPCITSLRGRLPPPPLLPKLVNLSSIKVFHLSSIFG